MDWRKKIEQAEVKRQTEAEQQRDLEKQQIQADFMTRLAEHQKSFKCHIKGCTVESLGPKPIGGLAHVVWNVEFDVRFFDWECPSSLEACSLCGRWTCSSHIHHGICKECGEKL